MLKIETDLKSPIATNHGFDVDAHIANRADNPALLMVEFGHAGIPVAYQQGFDFVGKRAFIGMEAWLWDPINAKRERLASLQEADQTNSNIIYTSYNLGGALRVDLDFDDSTAWYDGDYDTVTHLPDKVADEVLASDVFGDPSHVYSHDRTVSLLSEMGRITTHDGVVILRETITPEHSGRFLTDALALEAQLDIKDTITVGDPSWKRLEALYKGEPYEFSNQKPESFYMFLGKLPIET